MPSKLYKITGRITTINDDPEVAGQPAPIPRGIPIGWPTKPRYPIPEPPGRVGSPRSAPGPNNPSPSGNNPNGPDTDLILLSDLLNNGGSRGGNGPVIIVDDL
jgi:hypothetical protein